MGALNPARAMMSAQIRNIRPKIQTDPALLQTEVSLMKRLTRLR